MICGPMNGRADVMTRLTFDDAHDSEPVWTPDSRRIAFSSGRRSRRKICIGDAPTGPATHSDSRRIGTCSFHARGIRAAESSPSRSKPRQPTGMCGDCRSTGDDASGWTPGTPTAFVSGPAVERRPMFSSDGKWLAYDSDESGRQELYVRPFPGPGRTLRLSTDGGRFATWSRTKRELFYSVNEQIMVVAFTVDGDVFHAEAPHPVPGGRFTVRGEDAHVRPSPGRRPVRTRPGLRHACSRQAGQDRVYLQFVRRVATTRTGERKSR